MKGKPVLVSVLDFTQTFVVLSENDLSLWVAMQDREFFFFPLYFS